MKRIFYFASVLLFFACSTSTNNDTDALTVIKKLESQLLKNPQLKSGNKDAAQLVVLYDGFAVANPKDSLTPEFLFKAGEVSVGLEEYEKAIGFFERVYKNYPNYDKRVEALFMTAFTYDEHLKQKGKAADTYEKLIELHPNHEYATISKQVLETIHLSDEQLLELLKSNQATAQQ